MLRGPAAPHAAAREPLQPRLADRGLRNNDFAAAVVVAREQRVRRFLIVVIGVLAALRVRGLGHSGSPSPIGRCRSRAHPDCRCRRCRCPRTSASYTEPQRVERTHGRRPEEQIPIHARRRGAVRLWPMDARRLKQSPLDR